MIPCIHRNRVQGESCLCTLLERFVPLAKCETCPQAITGEPRPILIELQPAPPSVSAPRGKCQYRGEILAHEPCSCGASTTIPVHACSNPAVRPAKCVGSQSDFDRLADPDLRPLLTVCESCSQRDKVYASIIITVGPGYDRYVDTAFASATSQGAEVVIVWDSCEIPERYRKKTGMIRVDARNCQKARQAGLAATTGGVVLFLDADDRLPPGYVATALEELQAGTLADSRLAGVYPSIDYRSEGWATLVRKFNPPEWDRAQFERENFIAATAVVWRHALETSWAKTTTHDRYEDHHMWLQLVNDGWTFKRSSVTLDVQLHPDSMSRVDHAIDYATRYDLHNKPVTVFVPLSGRFALWAGLRDWLGGLPGRCRIVLCDASGNNKFGEMVRSDLDRFRDVRMYCQPPAIPGLADADRTDAKIARDVMLTCCRIYNRFAQECQTELALIIEDDVLPKLSAAATLAELIDGLDASTAGVSGVYRSRYGEHLPVAWTDSNGNGLQFVTDAALDSDERYLPIEGSGFGCLLVRREALRSVPQAAPGETWYDPRFWREIKKQGLSCNLANMVICDHLPAGQ